MLALLAVPAPSAQPSDVWREAPRLAALFAPAGGRSAAYRVFVTPDDLDTVLRRLGDDPTLVRAPGAWEPRETLPADAFGQSGRYARWTLARLYGAASPRVARGGRRDDGRVVESWTLVSPYPDATLRHLERGTLLMVLRLR